MPTLLTILLQLPIMGALVFLDLSTPLASLITSPLFLVLVVGYPALLAIWWSHPALRKYQHELLRYLSVFLALALSGVAAGVTWKYASPDASDLMVRIPGRIAFTFLAICLMMSPINTLTRRRHETVWLMLRKITGILSFLFFLTHALRFLFELSGYAPHTLSVIDMVGFLLVGMVSSGKMITMGFVVGIGMILLGITSNTISYRLLGRWWKRLHRLVYPIFVLSIVHVVWAERFSGYYTLLLVSVSILRAWAFVRSWKTSPKKPQGRATKYICVVCGYVYDEALGDPDSGIAPGTRWEDIPDTWYCPVCKVGKKDFEPYYADDGDTSVMVDAEITSVLKLTQDVIELTIRTSEPQKTLPGQFFRFVLQDFDGSFERSYSVAREDWNSYTFLIRIKPNGRAGKLWKKVQSGDILKISRVGGVFALQETENPKVFIATGTGLAPIYRMMTAMPADTQKTLYFGVRALSGVFYESPLRAIPNLALHIHLSQEDREGYQHGRINPSTIEATLDTEFYICGNPDITKAAQEALLKRGFVHVFSEAFE